MSKPSGMSIRFIRLLALSAGASMALFVALSLASDFFISNLEESTDFQIRRDEMRIESFQRYVWENGIAATDSRSITAWYEQKSLVLMEVYRNGKLLFNSSYYGEEGLNDQELDVNSYDWYRYYSVEFADGTAQVYVLGDDVLQMRMMTTVAEVIICSIAFLTIFLRGTRKVITYIEELHNEVQLLEGGNLDHPIEVRGEDELSQLASGLNSMRVTLKRQREAEALALEANQALITSMSHDLRTPLTKIKLYTEILKMGKQRDDEQALEFLERIDGNADRIKDLSDGIFQFSLGTVGVEGSSKPVDLRKAFSIPLSDMKDYLAQKGFTTEYRLEWPERRVLLDESFVTRLLDNVASNIDKYADSSIPVVVSTLCLQDKVGLAFRNAVSKERPARDSRMVGLANVQFMMNKMDGSVQVEEDGESFSVTFWFKCA